MGNESGKLKDLEMDKTPVESSPYWTLYNALASSTANEDGKQYVSVFQSKSPPADSNWTPQDSQPLFRATKVTSSPFRSMSLSIWEIFCSIWGSLLTYWGALLTRLIAP